MLREVDLALAYLARSRSGRGPFVNAFCSRVALAAQLVWARRQLDHHELEWTGGESEVLYMFEGLLTVPGPWAT